MTHPIPWIAVLFALSVSPAALADPSTASRDEMQSAYAAQQQNSPSFFGSAPVYHIIPVENTITFAAEYQYYDVTVAPPGVDAANRTQLTERLDMSGWSAAPYVAFSAKNFGIGFAGEVGNREAYYHREAGAASGGYEEHLGVAQYSGLGLEAFWTPAGTLVPRFAVPTIIAGGKSLNVIENSSGELTDPYSAVTMQKYQFAVYNYDAGFNVRLNLVKHFAVIPWIDYSAYSFTTPKPSAGGNAPVDPTVTDDANLFWRTAPPLTYGIDFAVRLYGLDIHLGGLIGILGTLDKGSDRIQDNSHTVSISLDTKGG